MCFFFSRWVLDLVVTSPCPLTTTAKKIPRVWASVTNSVSLCGRQQTPRQFTAPFKTSCPRRYISGSTLTSLVRFVKCFFLWVFPRLIIGIVLFRNVLPGWDPSGKATSDGVGRQTLLPSEPKPTRQSVRSTHSQNLLCAELTEKIQTAESNMINTSLLCHCNILYLISNCCTFSFSTSSPSMSVCYYTTAVPHLQSERETFHFIIWHHHKMLHPPPTPSAEFRLKLQILPKCCCCVFFMYLFYPHCNVWTYPCAASFFSFSKD